MGVPGADDIMLGYQSTSFHDALAMRDLLGRKPAPEFEAWLARQGLIDDLNASVRPEFPAASAHSSRPDTMADEPTIPPDDIWNELRRLSGARIGLQRTGASLATGRCSTSARARESPRRRA